MMVRDLMESVDLHLMANVDQELMDQDWAANVDLHLMAIVVLHLMANVDQDPMVPDPMVPDPMDQDPMDQDPMDQDPMDHVRPANEVHREAVHLVHHNRSALNEQTRNRSQAIGSTLPRMPLK